LGWLQFVALDRSRFLRLTGAGASIHAEIRARFPRPSGEIGAALPDPRRKRYVPFMTRDVFLSYSSEDRFAADEVRDALERNGVRVRMAPSDVRPDMNWGSSINDAIHGARVMVLVFSGAAIASPRIELEVERAINKGLPVIPFRIEDIQPSKGMGQHLERLARVVKRVIETKNGEFEPSARAEAAPALQRLRPKTAFDIFGSNLPDETFDGVFPDKRQNGWREVDL
jgi:hypothetical protein